MALKGILGYDGVTPVMTPDGTKPVLMESPCPYANFELDEDRSWIEGLDFTHGEYGGATCWYQVAAAEVTGLSSGVLRLRLISPAAGKALRVTMSYGGSGGAVFDTAYANMVTVAGRVVGSLYEISADTVLTCDVAEPYYRYALSIVFTADLAIGQGFRDVWMRFDCEFVDA